MLRKIAATLLGVLAGILAISLVQALGHRFDPPPENPEDLEVMRAFIAGLPLRAFLFVLASYVIGSFFAGWTAGKVGKTMRPAWIAGGVLMLAGILNVVILPHPTWFMVASLSCYLPCAWFGARQAGAHRPAG